MKGRKRRTGVIPKGDEKGIALIITLWAVALLFLLGIVFLSAAGLESTIASNEIKMVRAFHLAEAGIEHAKKALEGSNLSAVLDGTDDVFAGAGNSANLAGGTYEVEVKNNIDDPATAEVEFPRGTILADASGDPNVDSDGIVVLTSTGTVQGVEQSIEMVVQGGLPFPRIPGAVVQVSNGWNDMDVSGTVSGFDESGTCPDQAGHVHRGGSVIIEGSGTWEGDPAARVYDSAIDDPMWDDPDQVVAMVEEWMNDPNAVTITSSPGGDLGTQDNPQITVWDPSSGSGGGNFTGYGILIIDTSSSSFTLSGNFHFHGLIVDYGVNNSGGGALELHDGTLHGALLAVNNESSPSGEATEVGVLGGAQVNYNCAALATYAGGAAGAGGGGGGSDPVTVLSWRPL